jgi:hypothetical protein
LLHNGIVNVKINNEIDPYFQSAKGVKQGNPSTPIVFNMVGESMTKMVQQAQHNGLFTGLAPDLVENGVVILQYIDYTVICLSHDPEKATNI